MYYILCCVIYTLEGLILAIEFIYSIAMIAPHYGDAITGRKASQTVDDNLKDMRKKRLGRIQLMVGM